MTWTLADITSDRHLISLEQWFPFLGKRTQVRKKYQGVHKIIQINLKNT